MTPAFSSASSTSRGAQARRGASMAGGLLLRRSPTELTARVAEIADKVGLALLMLTAGMLLFRPADLIPVLAGVPIYEFLITGCLAVSLPRVWGKLSARSLRENGITVFVLLLVPAVMLSHLAHANTYDARIGGLEMAKGCIFFLLVVALVRTPQKLNAMLSAVIAAVFAVTVLAVLQYHGVLNLEALKGVQQSTGDPNSPVLLRLCGIGVFNDPNDFSLILVIAAIMCVYWIGERRAGRARWGLLIPLGLFGYALILTHSRGGLMAAVGATLVFLQARLGWRNALFLACLIAPVLLVPSWGRQTSVDLDNPEDTFQTRLQLWYESLELFRAAPILGVGQGKLTELIGGVTHNSYLHAFAEMGMLGGTAFIGAFYFVLRGLWRAAPADVELARLRPYVFALTFGYATGLLSLSRCYVVFTLMVLGLATAYLVMASRSGRVVVPRWSTRCIGWAMGIGLAFLGVTYLFVQVMLNKGPL